MESEDEIVIMIVPDYQMLQYVQKIASSLSDDPVRILLSLLKTHPFTLTGKTVGWSVKYQRGVRGLRFNSTLS